MVGDEMSEKLVAVGFRCAGKVTSKVLIAVLTPFLKLGKAVGYKITPNQKTLTKIVDKNKQTDGIEVEKSDMKGFDKIAKKYRFEYSLKREKNDPNAYMFIFQAKDWAKLEMVTRDLVKNKSIDHTAFVKKIEEAREKAFHINKAREQERSKERTTERTKPKKEKVVER